MNVIRELLVSIQELDKHPQKANRAFNELYRILYVNLFTISKYICKTSQIKESEEFAADILQDALQNFLVTAGKFNLALYKDEEALKKGLMSWIKKLILIHFWQWKNSYYDGDFKNTTYIHEELEDQLTDFEIDTDDKKTVKDNKLDVRLFDLQRIHDEIKKLSKVDQLIIEVTMMHGKHMPSKILKELCKATRLKPATVRKRRSRAINQLKKALIDK